ncbi:hypothetical protein BC829DRAFT_385906 [Chytridium lagenaria]|nr:hypothetical protein BC829DRAFT_385906 [Chytridium lagenaria]
MTLAGGVVFSKTWLSGASFKQGSVGGLLSRFPGKISLVFALLSILAGAAGLPLDKHVCQFFTENRLTADFNVAHMLFLGCDLAFLFLMAYVTIGVVPRRANC